ncbi:MAG: hypothetical protein KDD77_08110 [Caldilineaceae bacterium]|nr:hypothetical protein [Caldilineaceae bacterium]
MIRASRLFPGISVTEPLLVTIVPQTNYTKRMLPGNAIVTPAASTRN